MIWCLIILCGVAMAGYFKMISGYVTSWGELDTSNPEKGYSPKTSVTVIVSARNEASNIADCVKSLKAQSISSDLVSFIIVDDHSEDSTADIARAAIAGDDRFRVIALLDDEAGKKDAISKAVAMSDSELIVTSDADCEFNPNWLLTLVSTFEQHQPDMILAPVVFRPTTSLLNRLLRLEFMALMGSSGATARQGAPTMCNGANLCYRRSAFNAVNGFEGIDDNPSGDDVFLMLKMNNHRPGSILFTKASSSIVKTNAPLTLKAFWQQRKRWLSKKTGYENGYLKKTAYTVFFSNLAMLICLAITGSHWMTMPIWAISVLIILAKVHVDQRFLLRVGKDLGISVPFADFLLAELFLAIYIPLIGIAGRSHTYTWKNRKINLNE